MFEEKMKKELKINKKELRVALNSMLNLYTDRLYSLTNLEYIKGRDSKMRKQIIKETLDSYNDMYEWLQGRV
jgi:hypothetical protein